MKEVGSEMIALDGKTGKGSRDRKNKLNPLHMVSAWTCHRLVLGQEATQGKLHEDFNTAALPRSQ